MKSQRSDSRASVWKKLLLGWMLFGPLVASAVPCDVNASGRVDAADIQTIINATLGRPVSFPCDVDGSGRVDARDLQLTVNASLGHTVGLGVPDVIGLTLEDAEAAIRTAGLTIDAVTRVYSTYVPEGSVMTQIPPAGAIAWPGTAVDLTVSNGLHPLGTYALERVLPQIYEPWYLDHPKQVAAGPDGSVYVGESNRSRIAHFSSSGGLLAEWGAEGSGPGEFDALGGIVAIAVGADNSVYVLSGHQDAGLLPEVNSRIQKFTAFGAFITQWQLKSAGPLSGLTVGPDGSVYAANIAGAVYRFTANGGFISRWYANYYDSSMYGARLLAAGPDGSIYVLDVGGDGIQRFTASGDFVQMWGYYNEPSLDIRLMAVRDLSVSSDGSVYVLSGSLFGENVPDLTRIQQFTASGDFVRKWGSWGLGDGQFNDPQAIAASPDGSVYLADTWNKRIQKFTATGMFVTKWGSIGANEGEFASPLGVAVAQDGTFYVADTGNHRIQRFTSSGEFLLQWGTCGLGDGQFQSPYDVATAPDGSVHVIDSTGRIQQFTASGVFVVLWNPLDPVPPYTPARYGLAVGPDGSVYTVDGSRSMRRFTSPGVLAGVWNTRGSGEGEFNVPSGVAVGPDSSVYVADLANNRIQKFTVSGQFVAQWGTLGEGNGQFKYPCAVTVSPDGSVFVCDYSNNRIQRFTSDGVFLEEWGSSGTGNGQFRNPCAVAAGPDGEIYVVDTDNNRIQKFVPTP